MTFLLRCVLLTLATFGFATVLTSIAVGVAWWLRGGTHRITGSAAGRANALLRLRLLPVSVALLAAAFAAVGLWRFESREAHEVFGWTLRAGAALGACVITIFVLRLWQAHRETQRLLALWLADATRIALPGVTVPAYRVDTGFPVVAVVRMLRPILIVDAAVLDACTHEELAAILAHEQGHLRRWDNVRRALFSATPDLLAWTPAGTTLADDWRIATEEAADDLATEQGGDTRVHLAQALIRVARLAPSAVAASSPIDLARLPASALYRGDSVEGRVRRLFAAPAGFGDQRRGPALAVCLSLLTTGLLLQRQIHDLVEIVVASLP